MTRLFYSQSRASIFFRQSGLSILLLFFILILTSLFGPSASSQTLSPYVSQGPRIPRALAVSRSGDILASGEADGARLYDLVSRKEVRTLEHFDVRGVAFSRNGLLATIGKDSADIPGSLPQYSIKIWNPADGRLLKKIIPSDSEDGHALEIDAMDISPIHDILAAACADQSIRLWDLSSGKELRRIRIPSRLLTLKFSADGQTLGGGEYHKLVRMWRLEDGVIVHTFAGHASNVNDVAFSPDGTKIVSGGFDKKILIWNLEKDESPKEISFNGQVRRICFSKDGRQLIVAAGEEIVLIDGRNGTILSRITPYFTDITALSFVSDGNLVAGSTWDDKIALWDWRKNKVEFTFAPASPVVDYMVRQSANGQPFIFSESFTKTVAWNIETGEVTGSLDKTLFHGGMWSRNGDGTLIGMSGLGVAVASESKGMLWEEPGAPFTIHSFAPNGTLIASGGSDGFLRVREALTGKIVKTIDLRTPAQEKTGPLGLKPISFSFNFVTSVNFSPDSQEIAVSVSRETGNSIQIFEVRSGQEVAKTKVKSEFVSQIIFDNKTKRLVYGDDKGKIVVFDFEKQKQLFELIGHTGRIRSLLFDEDRNMLFSGSLDGTIRIWDLVMGRELLQMISTGGRDWIIVTPDGLFDGTAEAMSKVAWRVGATNQLAPLESFYNDFYYPGLYQEVIASRGAKPRASIDIATALQLPGLRTMLSQDLVRLRRAKGKTSLCFQNQPTVVEPTLLLNAMPYTYNVENVRYGGADCPHEIPLPPANQYQLANSGGDIFSSASSPKWKGFKSFVSKSTLHIQTIAIGQYDPTRTGLSQLPTPVVDAAAIESFFSRGLAQQSAPYHAVRVWKSLRDGEATRVAIIRRLEEIAEEAKEDDVVVLYLSGHGMVPAGQEMFYFAPADIQGPDPHQQRESGISTAMLADALRAIPSRRMLLILDTCQSGGAIESLSKIAQVKQKKIRNEIAASKNHAGSSSDFSVGIHIVATASPLQVAVAPVGGHSYLTSAFLNAVSGSACDSDGTIWTGKVIEEIKQQVTQRTQNDHFQQTPLVSSVGADFPLGKVPCNRAAQ